MHLSATSHVVADPSSIESRTRAGGGAGLYAARSFAPGDAVTRFHAARQHATPSRYTLQAGDAAHVELAPAELAHLNHGCDPNTVFDFPRGLLVALAPIAAGDELRCFYPASEWVMSEPFACDCGSARCLGTVRGARHLPPSTLAAHVLAPHVEKALARRESGWWQRDDLRYVDGVLTLAGRSLEQLAREAPERPVFVVSAGRVLDRINTLRSALERAGLPGRVFYAVKANRNPSLLAHLAAHGVGADVCSPGELRRARTSGFEPARISFTGTSITEADFALLARHPEVRVHLDSVGAIRRFARVAPGRTIGLRINPGRGMGALHYAGDRVTKFGVGAGEFEEALAVARECGLRVGGLHWHLGWGLLGDALDTLDAALGACVPFLDRVGPLDWLDVGGGLGVPRTSTQEPLDFDAWAAVVARHLRGRAPEIAVEPGTSVAMDAGVLLMPVVDVAVRGGRRFAHVAAGMNLDPNAAYYGLTLPIVPVRESTAPSIPTVVAGNVNEAMDVFDEAAPLPAELAPGDTLALLLGGAYGSSMASNHCMRGDFEEVVLPPA